MLGIKIKKTLAEPAPPPVGTVAAVPGWRGENVVLDIRIKDVRKLAKPNKAEMEPPAKCVGMEKIVEEASVSSSTCQDRIFPKSGTTRVKDPKSGTVPDSKEKKPKEKGI